MKETNQVYDVGSLVKLTKNELKVIAMCQGWGMVQGSTFVENIYERKRERCMCSLDKLCAIGVLRQVGILGFEYTGREFVVVEITPCYHTVQLGASCPAQKK